MNNLHTHKQYCLAHVTPISLAARALMLQRFVFSSVCCARANQYRCCMGTTSMQCHVGRATKGKIRIVPSCVSCGRPTPTDVDIPNPRHDPRPHHRKRSVSVTHRPPLAQQCPNTCLKYPAQCARYPTHLFEASHSL